MAPGDFYAVFLSLFSESSLLSNSLPYKFHLHQPPQTLIYLSSALQYHHDSFCMELYGIRIYTNSKCLSCYLEKTPRQKTRTIIWLPSLFPFLSRIIVTCCFLKSASSCFIHLVHFYRTYDGASLVPITL